MKLFYLVLAQTVLHAFRKGGGAFGTCGFYILVVTLFSFALGPEGIRAHAAAVMSVGLLLASVTALPMLYERDEEDGTLEQYQLQSVTLEFLALAKITGLWIAVTGPILIVSPVLAIITGISAGEMVTALWHLLLASPTLVAIGSVTAALTLGAKRGGLLQALVMLPLSIPVLIFAATLTGRGASLFLAGLLLALVPLSCLVSAALIRMGQE